MAVHHARNHDPDQLQGSQRVRRRATELLRLLEPDQVRRRLEPMLAASRFQADHTEDSQVDKLPDAVRDDLGMLCRWGYDVEQLMAIEASIEGVAESD